MSLIEISIKKNKLNSFFSSSSFSLVHLENLLTAGCVHQKVKKTTQTEEEENERNRLHLTVAVVGVVDDVEVSS